MRYLVLALPLLLGTLAPAQAAIHIGVGISVPGISIGIHVPVYPRLVLVPGYPVYHDPQSSDNYFFYDGLYWVYQQDTWYQSAWYDGPWQACGPAWVPSFVLRVPVRYYRRPPLYFRGWVSNQAPHWGEHWGHDWEQRNPNWNHGDHRVRPAAAPLPSYQRNYGGDRYPREVEQQHVIRTEQYHYQPKEAVTRQTFEQRGRPTPQPQDQRQDQRQGQRQEQRPDQPQAPPQSQPPDPSRDNREQDRGKDKSTSGEPRGKP